MNVRYVFLSPQYFIHPLPQLKGSAELEVFNACMALSREEGAWNQALHEEFCT